MTEVYDGDREFRLKILALCLDDSWMKRYGDSIIQASYFEREDEVAFATAILTYRGKYGRSPIDPTDVIQLCNGKYSVFITDLYEIAEYGDLEYAADVAILFAKEQAAKLAILDSVDDVRSGNMQKPIERMKAALQVGEGLVNTGLDPIRDIDNWLYTYWDEKTRTGLLHVDHILDGGISGGEMLMYLAPMNRGKSLALINTGYAIASIGSGKNVVHFTHEMRSQQVAKRYAARMVFRFPKSDDNLDDYAEELIVAARSLLVGNIRIIDGKKTTSQIEAHIEQLESEDFAVGAIVEDYLDLVVPPKHYSERRFELSATYEWFRSYCDSLSIPGFTASQAGRQALSKEIITMQDIAEDIGKAAIADVIVAVCQTREEKAADQCRLFMAKVRDAESAGLIAAKYYPKSQAIITTGNVKLEKEPEDV